MDRTGAAALTDRFEHERRGLLAHSYRMLGSWDEAEDAVQEAYLRAFRAWSTFEHRSSVRVWLYRIVTNVCLTALTGRSRRALPSGLAVPATDTTTVDPAGGPADTGLWIQPIPTTLVGSDPEAEAVAREGVRLAFVAGLQYLPARMGWTVPWYSSHGSTFNDDLGLGGGFGLSVLLRDGDEVFRTYFTNGRGVDRLQLDFNLLDLTPYGRQEAWEDSPEGWPQDPTMSWLKPSDEYEARTR